MTHADHKLLEELTWELSRRPFAGALRVQGVWMSRDAARAMDRMLLRQRVQMRRMGEA